MTSDLWDWALRAYAGEGVAEACLALQDDHGQCVPLLLWAAWRGEASQADEAAQIARNWQAVILPLRDARRRLKTEVSVGDEADRLALRTQVKAAELQAEKVLLARLAALSDGKSMLNQDVAAPLRAAVAAWGGPVPEDALVRLVEALTKGDFLRYTQSLANANCPKASNLYERPGPHMHDDTHIRSLRGKDGLHVVEGDKLDTDVERRVAERTDAEFARLELVPPAQKKVGQKKAEDEHRVRELPINADTVKLRNELALLKQEHKDLDDSISALEIVPQPDQILIARLKRKKLSLRDQITKIEDKIRPDIIA